MVFHLVIIQISFFLGASESRQMGEGSFSAHHTGQRRSPLCFQRVTDRPTETLGGGGGADGGGGGRRGRAGRRALRGGGKYVLGRRSDPSSPPRRRATNQRSLGK